MAIAATLIIGILPMLFYAMILYWIDRFEKEPIPMLVGVFLWGMVIASGGAFILNTILGETVYAVTASSSVASIFTGAISAPFIEEGLKGLAVLLVFLFFRSEFDTPLDGIVYAGITALGFAAVENSVYIWRGYLEGGWAQLFLLAFVRVILVGWQHPVYTAFTGLGLAFSRMSRRLPVKILASLGGYMLAVITHSFHNALTEIPFFGDMTGIIGILLDWSGVVFLLAIIIWTNWLERRNMVRSLREEMQNGIISPVQYRTACSAWAQTAARLASLFKRNYRNTNRFYQVCGELSNKKVELAKMGNERGNQSKIDKYRQELARLASMVEA